MYFFEMFVLVKSICAISVFSTMKKYCCEMKNRAFSDVINSESCCGYY